MSVTKVSMAYTASGNENNLDAIAPHGSTLGDYLANNAVFNVMDADYGAKGDGTADDTQAIQDAFDVGDATSGVLHVDKRAHESPDSATVPGSVPHAAD